MKKSAVVVLTFLNFSFVAPAQSHTLEVVGPCESEAVFISLDIAAAPGTTLGDFSVRIFNDHKLPFTGDRMGIASIFDSPTGIQALEILSDTQFRAYGWCVEVDGHASDQMIDQVILPEGNSRIVWFYAWALYESGVWTQYCTPSWQTRSPYVCPPKPMPSR